jgi:hypothetical protein
VDTLSTYGYDIAGQHVGRTRAKPKIREWLEEGRLETVSEGKRKQQVRVNKQWEDGNF